MSKSTPALTDLARMFKALSDPNRLAILKNLRDCCGEGCCVGEEEGRTVSQIAERFDLALSTVSHHLKELRTAGLIVCTKQGKRVQCSINPAALKVLEEFMRS